MPTDTTCIRCTTVVLENELQHYGPALQLYALTAQMTELHRLKIRCVNFCLLTTEISGLIFVPMYLYWVKIDLTPAFVVLPFRTGLEYCYADGRINSSNDQATCDINLVGF